MWKEPNPEQEESRFNRKPITYSIFRIGRATPLFTGLFITEVEVILQEIKAGQHTTIPKNGIYYKYKEKK